MANIEGALTHFKEGLATLRTSSAAGYPESIVAQAINRIEVGIAHLEGKEDEVAVKPILLPENINAIPATLNRGDKNKAVPKPAVVKPSIAKPPAAKKFEAKYADGFTVQKDDRAQFPDTSPGGAKRVSIEKLG